MNTIFFLVDYYIYFYSILTFLKYVQIKMGSLVVLFWAH